MKLKFLTIISLVLFCFEASKAETAIAITVGGDADKFYPVTLSDAAWWSNMPTKITIGRSNVHENGAWTGTIMAELSFHITRWGHGSNFIDVKHYNANVLIAGWADITWSNGDEKIMVWLKGGGITYHLSSAQDVQAVVYDGVQNPLPYQEPNGPARTFVTEIAPYVNRGGLSVTGSAYFNGGGTNFFNGKVGIGTTTPDEKLAVNGKIHANEVKVDLNVPAPDYVFEEDYKVPPLLATEQYIKANKHLPEVPSAKDMEQNGLNLSDMNMLLLKKIEEMTLQMIEMKKEIINLKSKK